MSGGFCTNMLCGCHSPIPGMEHVRTCPCDDCPPRSRAEIRQIIREELARKLAL